MQAVQLAQAVWEMVSQPDLARTVDQVLVNACAFTPAAEVGIVRLQGEQRVEIAGTSGPRARRADELQLHYGEGPCLQAALARDVCLLEDARYDDRWPRLSPAVAELGWSSVLSLPLLRKGTPLGALNLYSDTPACFGDDDVAWARVFARHASVALGVRIAEEELRQAMADQHLLGQAKGILMERYGLDLEAAQAALEQHARTSGAPLSDVASTVISTRRLPTPARPR